MDLQTFCVNDPNVEEGERWLSVMGGAVLAVAGLGSKSPGGLLAALAGGYLLYRGLRGHCLIYELLGIQPEYYETMLAPDSPLPPEVDYGDEVMESSWESFPTSDPPSWTMGRKRGENGG